MTEDLSKMFDVVEKQKNVADALKAAEKTLDINDFRKAVSMLNELSEEEKEPLMESFKNVGHILRVYDRQRQSEIEELIAESKEQLDESKLEEAEKLVEMLLDEENKEIYRGIIKEYDEEFIQPKKSHDEIINLIDEARDTLDESLLDQARFLIDQVKSEEERQKLIIEASEVQRFLNGIDEPDMSDNRVVSSKKEPEKDENKGKKEPEKNQNKDDLENKKYEEAKKLVDTALKTQKGEDINNAIKAINELKDEEKKKELKDKLNSIKQIKDSDEDKKEPDKDKPKPDTDKDDKEEGKEKDEDKDLIVPEVQDNKPAIAWKKVISLAAGVGIGAGIALALGPSGVFGFAVAGVVANVIIEKKLNVPEEDRLAKLHKVEMIEDPKNFKERFRNKINKARIYFNSDEGLKNLRCTINAAIVSGGIATVAINPYGPINWYGGVL